MKLGCKLREKINIGRDVFELSSECQLTGVVSDFVVHQNVQYLPYLGMIT